jgi:hypothetical protein
VVAPELPRGRRFSHLYMDPGDVPGEDSQRMRTRIGTRSAKFLIRGIRDALTEQLGVAVNGHNYGVYASFFEKAELRDVLDSVTIIYGILRAREGQGTAEEWLEFVAQVLKEENVAFDLDNEGGVHRRVDPTFSAVRASAISSLAAPRFQNAAVEFEGAMEALDATPMNGKQAIRRTFTAAEGLFRLMFPKVPRLGAAEIKATLVPAIAGSGWEPHAARSASAMATSFGAWADAVHHYRHEQGQEEPAQPPEHLTHLLVSQGSGYIRWLAQLAGELGL